MMDQVIVAGLDVWQVAALVIGIVGATVVLLNAPSWPASRPRVLGGALAVLVAVVVWALTT